MGILVTKANLRREIEEGSYADITFDSTNPFERCEDDLLIMISEYKGEQRIGQYMITVELFEFLKGSGCIDWL